MLKLPGNKKICCSKRIINVEYVVCSTKLAVQFNIFQCNMMNKQQCIALQQLLLHHKDEHFLCIRRQFYDF